MTTGERIRAARKRAGLTQAELAERIGVTQQVISQHEQCGMADSAIRKYESGKVTPKIETLAKIAKALGVSVVELSPELENAVLERDAGGITRPLDGEAIKRIAAERGISLKQISRRAGVPYTTLYHSIVRKSRMTCEQEGKIAKALGIAESFPPYTAPVWQRADQLPRLEERREVDPDEGEYIFSTSAPLLLWCPDKDPHQVVGRYLQEESWVGFADRNGTPMHPTHWMELPGGPEE